MLQVSPAVRSDLQDTYYAEIYSQFPKEEKSRVDGPKNVYYGKISGSVQTKDVYYAMGDIGFTDNPLSRQDGPHVWRKRGTAAWEYLGDTGGQFCGKVPRELVQIWGKSCS